MPLPQSQSRSWCGHHHWGLTSWFVKISSRVVTDQSVCKGVGWAGGGGGGAGRHTSILDRKQKGITKCQSISHLDGQHPTPTPSPHQFTNSVMQRESMWKSSRVSKWGSGFFRGVFPTFWHIWFLKWDCVWSEQGLDIFLPSATLTSTSSYESPLHSGLLLPSPPLPLPPGPTCSGSTALTQHWGNLPAQFATWCPRHLLARAGEPAGSRRGGNVGQHFLSLCPTPRPRGSLPLPWVFPVSQARSIQDTHCQGSECHIPVASHPHREGWDSCMGGRGGAGRQAGRELFSRGRLATVPITLRPRSRGGKGNRSPTAPSRVGKKQTLNLAGLGRGRSSRNCKMQSENIKSWASVP